MSNSEPLTLRLRQVAGLCGAATRTIAPSISIPKLDSTACALMGCTAEDKP